MIKILLIGAGAREHALARAIVRSGRAELLTYAPNTNPGIASLSKKYQVGKLEELPRIVDFAKDEGVDYAVIGPELPLALGLADELQAVNIPTFGPLKNLARLESSKGFTRDLMKKYALSGLPRYARFPKFNETAREFLQNLNGDYVIKADGLMAGKGVKVSGEHLASENEAVQFCKEINGAFVIEEKLVGPEFSLLSFTDGKTLKHMPPVQDHKRAFEGDQGPNTGGMGTYTMQDHLLPFLTPADVAAAQAINEAIIQALYQETGEYYRGVLYGGFMKTTDGVKVIEYNARFGDPEAINLLALLETDLVDIIEAIAGQQLAQVKVHFAKKATVCKYVVPQGYPDAPRKGDALLLDADIDHDALYFASVDQKAEQLLMLGSRAIAVLGMADGIEQAEQQAEKNIGKINGPVFHRKDIGTASLINERMKLIKNF